MAERNEAEAIAVEAEAVEAVNGGRRTRRRHRSPTQNAARTASNAHEHQSGVGSVQNFMATSGTFGFLHCRLFPFLLYLTKPTIDEVIRQCEQAIQRANYPTPPQDAVHRLPGPIRRKAASTRRSKVKLPLW